MPITVNYIIKPKRHYGLGGFLGDVFLTFITGGIWFVWLIFKFLRK